MKPDKRLCGIQISILIVPVLTFIHILHEHGQWNSFLYNTTGHREVPSPHNNHHCSYGVMIHTDIMQIIPPEPEPEPINLETTTGVKTSRSNWTDVSVSFGVRSPWMILKLVYIRHHERDMPMIDIDMLSGVKWIAVASDGAGTQTSEKKIKTLYTTDHMMFGRRS